MPRSGGPSSGPGGATPTEIAGVVRRAGPIAAHWAGYVAFEELDDETTETADLVHEYLAVASVSLDPTTIAAGMGGTAQSA